MRLTLRQLHIFTAVADTGSTTAAGLQVALSQSATSGALNELEALLDAQLFDRVGKRLVLNDTGRALLPQARAVLDGAQGIEKQFGLAGGADKDMGLATHLRVGASTTIGNYLLPALVASHLRDSPATTIDVTIGNTSEIATAVARLEVDVGLIEGPCHEPELHAQPWLEDVLAIVCAPSHPLMRADLGARVGLKALRTQRWLLREPGSGTREAVEHALLPHLHQWVQPMQLGSTEAIKQAAAEGLGLTCLSLCAVQDLLTLRRLVLVNTTLPRLARRFYLIRHRQKKLSNSLQRFVSRCEAADPNRLLES
ncbi:LysR family transcriptional regulator [Variovorax sp. dw_954]|uniref:LysR family transcriptional regulator n=1 Tax=Variovorax sp. dw_954 TaxID=2720078 RepID=UPI001BD1D5E1|nr:LysR family transcriptional regulator [Variovorax sp. dw_954]